uniref:Uncharacterized protein n=1 Tax=Tenacibaculum sp. Pbs-1 TaxID=3238748 RepID=A0AB33L1B7_9FLAO
MKDVFPSQKNTDSTFVFDLDTVKSFESLTSVFYKNYDNRKIRYYIRTLKNDVPFHIKDLLHCGTNVLDMLKQKNMLFIDYNSDSLFFYNELKFSFNKNNFQKILEQQFYNNDKNPDFADSPDKSLIFLEFINDFNDSKRDLKNKIDTISVSYFNFLRKFNKKNIDSLKKLYPLQIRLNEAMEFFDEKGNRVNFIPPPAPLEIVE